MLKGGESRPSFTHIQHPLLPIDGGGWEEVKVYTRPLHPPPQREGEIILFVTSKSRIQ